MFKWLGKLKIWKQKEPDGPAIHEYGRYLYKPVLARAISAVVGVSQPQVCAWVQDPNIQIYINDELLQGMEWARRRLESGNYEIKITQQNKIWRFFIG
jgi:hypothetical protein